MTAGRARQRRATMGTTQWTALGASALVILGLTFTLGTLVGRQWARHSPTTVVADPARKAAPAPRRSGLTEAALEQRPAVEEKLTFYKTLTAPLETTPFPVKAEPPAKPAAPTKSQASPDQAPAVQASPVKTVSSTIDRALPRAEERQAPAASVARADQPAPLDRRGGGQWTVQVGVFGNVQQAIDMKKGLGQKGLETQIAPEASGGQVRYRVRLGTFHSREEALREAERVRTERSLPTHVMAK
jgi:cell division protein FtsN